ncbi:hypothetical protein J8F10_30355 [Gemmata sp. G18]|uniref:DUF4178 domain-containing protein n=1 Tax=Gemmata palustris TaxID=2822762 RepID=A0ABS5C0Y2_9BACT|nr:hypothetical protein [Gemmata palustris]MBP3959568.1 hypothetical protein [Gemmata palustris]
MSLVVRCPACRGASRVPVDAIGQMVGCPRCQSPFVAEEDAPAAPLPSRAHNSPVRANSKPRPAPEVPVRSPPRPSAAIPIAPPRRLRPELTREELVAPAPGSAPVLAIEVPDPEHDPHSRPVAGLPVSVLVGFALMPFGIPLLWFVGPLVTGKEASLSLAVPVSLAIAASALCLGVVYTIDWTAATRIKGVLMLVGLSYLSASGLFFLKKDLMDRVQKFFSVTPEWHWVRTEDKGWHVRMPFPAVVDRETQPLPGLARMSEVRRARYEPKGQEGPAYEYYFGAGPANPNVGDSADGWLGRIREGMWFVRVDRELKDRGGKLVEGGRSIAHPLAPDSNGRQWMFELGGTGGTVRIVQVFIIEGRVYYLSAEGPELVASDDPAERFFGSFEPLPRK